MFLEYKIIIKELLFNGANRDILSKDGLNAYQIVASHAEFFSEQQLRTLMYILQDQKYCICLMKHRPIKQMKKSPYILILGISINVAIIVVFYGFYNVFTKTDSFLAPKIHYTFLYLSAFFIMLAAPAFFIAAALDPGYLKKKYDYVQLVDQMLLMDCDLINLCTYCELIKSETSFHCQMCGKCTELFDHHCPFLNNCLGMRNYKYFLVFVFSYFMFLLCVIGECIRTEVDYF